MHVSVGLSVCLSRSAFLSIDCSSINLSLCVWFCLRNSVFIGKEAVTLVDGGSYMDSAEVFAMIRGLVATPHNNDM